VFIADDSEQSGAHLDADLAVDHADHIRAHRHLARRSLHATAGYVERPVMEVAFDDLAVDFASERDPGPWVQASSVTKKRPPRLKTASTMPHAQP